MVLALVHCSTAQAQETDWTAVLRPDVPTPPWSRRIPPTPPHPWPGLAPVAAWPPEPATPSPIDPAQMGQALEQLCGTIDAPTARRQAGWIIEHGAQHGVDPFLIAAVIYRQSRCRSTGKEEGLGLARIPLQVHLPHVHDGWYRYWVLEDGGWQPHELLFNRFPFTARSLRRPEPNIYFTAALIYVVQRQCRSLDAAVRQEPHRHAVSHLLWGDRVLGARFEDLVLQSRRRLVRLYLDATPPSRASYRGVALVSPLDGVPRKVLSPYNDRREGRRRHRGIDFVSTHGEPVRAVADGVVVFAGVHHPRRGASNLPPAAARGVSPRRMGRGGLFVLIDHGNKLTSGYFHLWRYRVRQGERVKAGQIIGKVGASGIRESPAHLHFELRVRGHNVNPTRPMRPYLIPFRVPVASDRPAWPGRRRNRCS